jgi:hypothetical protein
MLHASQNLFYECRDVLFVVLAEKQRGKGDNIKWVIV